MSKISVILMAAALTVWSFACGYWLGQSRQKVQYITKEVEFVKQISKKRAVIQSRPNITRDAALKLMREGKL